MPHSLVDLQRFHKWTRDFATKPFHSPFGRAAFGKLLPPPIVFAAHDWRREPLSWPIAGVHCAFDEAATLLLTSEHPSFFAADQDSFTQAQMLRYMWTFADDPSAGGILDDAWGVPHLSVGGEDDETESKLHPSAGASVDQDASGTHQSKASASGQSRRAARQQSKARKSNYRGEAKPAVGESFEARELRRRLDERIGKLSEAEKTAIIEQQDPELAIRNPALALAQAEYESMRKEDEEADDVGGSEGSAEAKVKLAKRLHGVR